MTSAVIERIVGRRVWDSRGRPTVEADVVVTGGALGRAIAPAGASTGSNEAVELRDGGAEFDGYGVGKALAAIETIIAPALRGMPIANQAAIDAALIALDGTANKARLGGNAVIAVSMAALHASAATVGEPLWRVLAVDRQPLLPMPMIQIFGGGAHAAQRLDLQDFLIVPVGAGSFDEAMVLTAQVYAAAGAIMAERGKRSGVADEGGWWPEFASNEAALDTLVSAIERAGLVPGDDVAIALDVAATQFGQAGAYRLAGTDLDTEALVEHLAGWCRRYPIISVEDPVAEDDTAGMIDFTRRVGDTVQVIGDDYLVTSARRVAQAAASGACNAVLIKPNQAGTITEAAAALEASRDAGWRAIVSARSGESEDVTVVHLAVGWGAGQLKVGSFARSERMAKWNEALRIEEALGSAARFASDIFDR
jgi:enolase